jgi:DNA-binding transcriptional LysR family regulator
MRLPDFEAWAIFAKVIHAGSFSQAAVELGLSKATVSKAIARLETRLGAHLIQRTSRRLALTDIGRQSLIRAERMIAEAEAADLEASSQAASPRGRVRITAPVQFGNEHIAPLLPELFAAHPDVTLDLHLSDQVVDLVGEGFDLAVRIASLADSSLRARRLCAIHTVLVGAPAYFARHGRPEHPRDLLKHRCFTYAYQSDPNRWHFVSRSGEDAAVAPNARFGRIPARPSSLRSAPVAALRSCPNSWSGATSKPGGSSPRYAAGRWHRSRSIW